MSSEVPAVDLNGITERFDDVTAVDAVDLEIADGESSLWRIFRVRQDHHPAPDSRTRVPDRGQLEVFGNEVGTVPPNTVELHIGCRTYTKSALMSNNLGVPGPRYPPRYSRVVPPTCRSRHQPPQGKDVARCPLLPRVDHKRRRAGRAALSQVVGGR